MDNIKSFKSQPIGIFDSGLGGLTVARSIHEELPQENIIYFGDTARVPYGNKSRSSIIRFAREIAAFLNRKKVKIIVVACNTASSFSIVSLRKMYPMPVVGVISAGVKTAVSVSKNKRIGVIGTNSTISSGAYENELYKRDASCRVFMKACPLFVPLVENRFINKEITYQIARIYLKGLKARNIDTLILGCTHYPLLKNVIKEVMGNVKLIDSSCAIASEVKEILFKKDLQTDKHKKYKGKIQCYVSDDVEGFRKSADMFFKEDINVKRVNI